MLFKTIEKIAKIFEHLTFLLNLKVCICEVIEERSVPPHD